MARFEWPNMDLRGEIARLKEEQGAIILAHSYQPPEILVAECLDGRVQHVAMLHPQNENAAQAAFAVDHRSEEAGIPR